MASFSTKKIVNATKWSALSQIVLKIISPVTNMILAHLLAPEIFGIVASITLVISFTDLFTEAGFQKYIVQHELRGDEKLEEIASVAFWTNLWISLLFLAGIIFFRDPIATWIGAPGKGIAMAVACISLPITSFSSIQAAIFQRNLRFKSLFWVRLISAAIPLAITVPLALVGLGYWALIIGKIAGNLYQAVAMTVISKWKPRLFYRFSTLKAMFSYSIWSLFESITVWLATNVDILIVGTILTSYYLGLYKTSMSTVNEVLRIVSSAILPVVFATISRLQGEPKRFNDVVYRAQSMMTTLVLPMGVGLFLYRELVTGVALGAQWAQTASFIGLWSLVTCITIAYDYICDEIYRAQGKPKLSFITHLISIIVLIPAVIWAAKWGFEVLIYVRSATLLVLLLANCFFLKRYTGISILRFFTNTLPQIGCTLGMAAIALLLQQVSSNMIWQFVSIIICAGSYLGLMWVIPAGRRQIIDLYAMARGKQKAE